MAVARINQAGRVSQLHALLEAQQHGHPLVGAGQAVRDPARPTRCVLHFGQYKTGTSSIQRTLAGIGARGTWRYLHGGLPNSSLSLQLAFRDDLARVPLLQGETLSEAQRMAVRAAVRQTMDTLLCQPANTYILSAEAMPKLGEAALTELVAWLRQRVDEVVAIGYLRPLHGCMQSMFQQHIKSGRFTRSGLRLSAHYPDYRGTVEPFDLVLGREEVTVRAFERDRLVGGDVVLDLATQLGLELAAADVQRANEGISAPAVQLLWTFFASSEGRRSGPELAKRMHQVRQRVLGLAGPKLAFSRTLVAPVAKHMADDIAWGEQRLGGYRLWDADAPDSPGAWPALDDATLLALLPEAVQWFNERLAAVGAPGLPDNPSQSDLVHAVDTLCANPEALRRAR